MFELWTQLDDNKVLKLRQTESFKLNLPLSGQQAKKTAH